MFNRKCSTEKVRHDEQSRVNELTLDSFSQNDEIQC